MTLPVATSTVAMMLFFGTNAILFFAFFFVNKSIMAASERAADNDDSDDNGKVKNKEKKQVVAAGGHAKEHSEPFTGTLNCFANLSTELFRVSLLMALTYICEKHWIFDHSGKTYSRDLFMFVVLLFFVYGFYTIQPIKDLSLLGRDQTEEWKGWMQFIFLLYHYFHAEEVYNSVRVMITCYVWMTGFGNFSFFYIKKDFGWLRVAQMLWRLNFSVLLLMWTHGNTWILYYICPMHTFYFLAVFSTMFFFSRLNYSQWGIRIKLMVVGIIIYLVWDYNSKLFDFIFGFMGTDTVVGANSGSVFEYYFRTSLDHWSTYFGMIFCLNYNLTESFFKFAHGWPLAITAVLMAMASVWWYNNIYSLDKLEYNLNHSYYAIIPLISYIFFRNITPGVRSGVSMSMHTLGKTTLETYLLQHHIWLTSNAKTLLTIVPNHPWINFLFATILFFVCSKELYRLTMTLRGMILPDPPKNGNDAVVSEFNVVARNNIIGSILVILFYFGIAYFVQHHMIGMGMFGVLTLCFGFSAVILKSIERFNRSRSSSIDNFTNQNVYKNATTYVIIAFLACLVVQICYYGMGVSIMEDQTLRTPGPVSWASTRFNVTRSCLDSISVGTWQHVECAEHIYPSINRVAYCDHDAWEWGNAEDTCPVGRIDEKRAKGAFRGKKIAFFGDSSTRGVYHQFIKLLDPMYADRSTVQLKHADKSFDVPAINTSVYFHWSPFAHNISDILPKVANKYDLVVVGVGVWDALWTRSVKDYSKDIEKVGEIVSTISQNRKNFVKVWINPPRVVNGKLSSVDKQTFMTEEVVANYRSAFLASSASKKFSNVIDTSSVSADREFNSYDGVHYSSEVYAVIAQMTANSYILQFPSYFIKNPPKFPPKETGGMSNRKLGFCVLMLAAVLLFTMDNFLGFGFVAMKLFGLSFDWKATMDAFHKRENIDTTWGVESSVVSDPTAIQETDRLLNNSNHGAGNPTAGGGEGGGKNEP